MKKKMIKFQSVELSKLSTKVVKGGNNNAPAGPMNPNAPPAGGGGHGA